MATMRVIAAGLSEEKVILRVRAALRDEDVESVTVHKEGSHLVTDKREFVVGHDGELRPLEVAAAVAVQTC